MKKFLGIFAILTAILLFTGCWKTTINSIDNDTNEETTNISDCRRWCDIIAGTVSKEDCYSLCETSKQLESDDIKDCDDIEKTSGGFVTKDICIQSKAIETKNPDFCEKIEASINKDSCYMSLAEEMENYTLCNKISNEIIKMSCRETEE